MMPDFGHQSEEQLDTCHPDLVAILRAAIKVTDFKVTKGHRTEPEQEAVFAANATKLKWPDSKHNRHPSRAVDILPYPVEWPKRETDDIVEYSRKMTRFHYLAGVVQGIANMMNIKIKWGGTFSNMFDGPHFELVDEDV